MVKEKEEKILDDIDARCDEIQSRLNMIEKPLVLLTAWLNRSSGNINTLFATAEQLNSWMEQGYFDEMNYMTSAQKILGLLREFEAQFVKMYRLFLFDFRETKRAENKLIRIEKDEIVLSSEEKGSMREDILGELGRIREAEKRFNKIIGSIRLCWKKTRELANDLRDEKKLYEEYIKTGRVKELKDKTRMGKIEQELKYMRDIIAPADGEVQSNLTLISNAILTLKSHVPALKKGAKYVTVRAA
ncbi:hypothetical protein JW707_00210 [Candidatus Woesearchaeota archaeon]|nr:hypothetical protein [Candidatus Woesearchaeota archaeon]